MQSPEEIKKQNLQQRHDSRVREFIKTNFGPRYLESSLARFNAPVWACDLIAGWLREPKHFLVYHGAKGIGKTDLCASIIPWAFENFDFIRYHKDDVLLSRLRERMHFREGEYLKILENMIDDDFVILDDIGSGINPEKESKRDLEWRREILFNFVDYRYNSLKPTLFTSNLTKEQFYEIYCERICSRLFAKENTIVGLWDKKYDKRVASF